MVVRAGGGGLNGYNTVLYNSQQHVTTGNEWWTRPVRDCSRLIYGIGTRALPNRLP